MTSRSQLRNDSCNNSWSEQERGAEGERGSEERGVACNDAETTIVINSTTNVIMFN